nr:ABC transporter ATP-binding protein [uncultured Caproiciproducens sp.]
MLEVLNLTKKYRNVLANDNLNFKVNAGEIAVLVGPNGAGKSTAIKCIAGLLRFNGNISVCGYPNKSVEAKRNFGYIPEIPAPIETLTVYEHMEFIARAYRVEDWKEKSKNLLVRMELDDLRKKLGKELSKGMQQKLSICCALLPEPKVILMDEPLIGLDPHAIKELKTMLMELRSSGCAILVSTHMLDSVREFWDKALIMMNGKIAVNRTRAEIESTGEDLEQLFFSITEGAQTGGVVR